MAMKNQQAQILIAHHLDNQEHLVLTAFLNLQTQVLIRKVSILNAQLILNQRLYSKQIPKENNKLNGVPDMEINGDGYLTWEEPLSMDNGNQVIC